MSLIGTPATGPFGAAHPKSLAAAVVSCAAAHSSPLRSVSDGLSVARRGPRERTRINRRYLGAGMRAVRPKGRQCHLGTHPLSMDSAASIRHGDDLMPGTPLRMPPIVMAHQPIPNGSQRCAFRFRMVSRLQNFPPSGLPTRPIGPRPAVPRAAISTEDAHAPAARMRRRPNAIRHCDVMVGPRPTVSPRVATSAPP